MIRKLLKRVDIKPFLIGILAYTLHLISYLIGLSYYKYKGIGKIANRSWTEIFVEEFLLNWFLMILVIYFIISITKYFIDKKISWKRTIIYHILLALIFSPLISSLYILGLTILDVVDLSNLNLEIAFNRSIIALDNNFSSYLVFATIAYIYYYFKKNIEIELEQASLKAELATTKIKVLKSQLQPHFLFNTLNSIQSLMKKDIKKSELMLVDLSNMLRETLNNKDEAIIELADEMKLVNKYLNIIRTRFSDDLKIELNIADNLENILIPSMLIQPTIENSIKHGYSQDNIKLWVLLEVFAQDNNTIILVKNNGKFLQQPYGDLLNNGLGIKNTVERLKTLYGIDNFKYEIYNSEIGVTTKITIPNQIAEFKLV